MPALDAFLLQNPQKQYNGIAMADISDGLFDEEYLDAHGAAVSRAFWRLSSMKKKRDVEYKRSETPKPQPIVSLKRPLYTEALAMYMVGDEALIPCTRCTGPNGKLQKCIYVEGEFKGSCANCHYAGVSSNCTLRPIELRGPRASSSIGDSPAATGTVTPVRKRSPPNLGEERRQKQPRTPSGPSIQTCTAGTAQTMQTEFNQKASGIEIKLKELQELPADLRTEFDQKVRDIEAQIEEVEHYVETTLKALDTIKESVRELRRSITAET